MLNSVRNTKLSLLGAVIRRRQNTNQKFVAIVDYKTNNPSVILILVWVITTTAVTLLEAQQMGPGV